MSQKRKNLSLFVGVGILGLVAWSAYASAAAAGSAECTAKVNAQADAIARKSGRNPSNLAKEEMLGKCSEAQIGLMLEGLVAKHDQDDPAKKEVRCTSSVRYAVANGRETSGRSEEALVSQCMALPSDHDPNCGYSSGEYKVIEAQTCVSKNTAVTSSHQFVAKAEKRVRKFDEPAGGANGSSDGGGASGTSAQ